MPTEQLTAWMGPHGAKLPPNGGAAALFTYFGTPSHRVAIQTLNCSLFLTPIQFPGYAVPLGDILTVFSGLGGVRYGRIWTKLIDVAEAAGVTDVGPARDFVRQQMGGDGAVVESASAPTHPTPENLDAIFQSLTTTFPMLSDCMDTVVKPMCKQLNASIINSDSLVDAMQPVIENFVRSTTGASMEGCDISGPLHQIIGACKALAAVLEPKQGNPSGTDMAM